MSLTSEEIEQLIGNKFKEQEEKYLKLFADQEKKYKKLIDEHQTKSSKKILEQLKELQKRIEVIEKDLIEISKDLESTQRTAYSTDQYQRRNNIEISGIPHAFDENLEEVCISLINSIIHEPGKPIEEEEVIGTYDIEGCHRLKTTNKDGTKNTILRFINRKVCEDIMSNKKTVKELEREDLGDNVRNIYFNDNLNSYYKNLAAKCRRLKKKRQISDTFISNGTVRIKLKDNTMRVITHQHDLDKLFPNFVYFE